MLINKMHESDAREICSWCYELPYSIYNMNGNEECVEELTSNSYYTVKDEEGKLIGFYCFGETAQVPIGNKYGAYDDKSFIDIGLGMKPEFCGQGLGYDFILKEIEFAKKLFSNDKIRLTVARFNKRAIKVYEKAGFKCVMDFDRVTEEGIIKFIIMELRHLK